jgi:hypothetical protein
MVEVHVDWPRVGVDMSKQERNEGKSGISDLTVIALVTSVLLPLVGWIVGFRARKQIVESDGRYVGRPFATAAIWIGGILTTGWLAMFLMMGISASLNHDDNGFMHRAGIHQGWNRNAQVDPNQNGNDFGSRMMGQPGPNNGANTNP